MIRRLGLRNWRSYENLDLPLDPGTTFVVAPNGVGKTSLVYGLAWAVFGQHSGVDPRACIRAGAESAEVQVEFDLPDGRRLSVSRTAKRRGTPTATYQMGGARTNREYGPDRNGTGTRGRAPSRLSAVDDVGWRPHCSRGHSRS